MTPTNKNYIYSPISAVQPQSEGNSFCEDSSCSYSRQKSVEARNQPRRNQNGGEDSPPGRTLSFGNLWFRKLVQNQLHACKFSKRVFLVQYSMAKWASYATRCGNTCSFAILQTLSNYTTLIAALEHVPIMQGYRKEISLQHLTGIEPRPFAFHVATLTAKPSATTGY
jgi:hypothetical protein